MTDPNQEFFADPNTSGDAADPLEVLLFETSPYGTVDAIVQHDQRSIYFFLQPRQSGFSPRACWVRNLVPGPYVINQADLLAGRQVVLPRSYAKSNQAGRLPRPDELTVIWFEEGNGAALIENVSVPTDSVVSDSVTSPAHPARIENVLAIIPPWSGQDGFHGYAAECATDSPVCWPLPKNPRLKQRVERAAGFWSSFLQSPDPFIELRDRLLSVYQALFGIHSALTANSNQPGVDIAPTAKQNLSEVESALTTNQNLSEIESALTTKQNLSGLKPATTANNIQSQYFSINGDQFPPRGMMQYQLADRIVLITVGMSLCPQPNLELSIPEPQRYRRIELAIELPEDFGAEQIAQARQQLARLAGYPWRNFRWLGQGHSCQFAGVFANRENVMLAATPSPNLRLKDLRSWFNSRAIGHSANEPSANDPSENDQNLSPRPLELLIFRDDPVNLIWLV